MAVGFDLDVRPGQGVGMFELGSSLWTVLATLQQHKTTLPQVDVKYDSTSPANTAVILHVRPHLDLLFSPLNQRLTLISIRRLRAPGTSLTVKYKDNVISSCFNPQVSTKPLPNTLQDKVFRRDIVNQVFGPTYPGEVMRYPGVWFGFDEDGGIDVGGALRSPKSQAGRSTDERAQEVKRIVVTQRPGVEEDLRNGPGVAEKDTLEEPSECPPMYGDVKKAVINLPGSLLLHLFSKHAEPPIEIRIGLTTAQDLVCDLGSPLRVHYKEDDRMNIHSSHSPPTTENNEEDDEGYFYNYFQLGIDFYLSGATHVVQKVILHSNVPGSHLFQRYKRCPWEIEQLEVVDPAPSKGVPDDDADVLTPSTSKSAKKTKKGKPAVVANPERNFSQGEQHPTTEGRVEQRQTVSLSDKIDVIAGFLSADSQPYISTTFPGHGGGLKNPQDPTGAFSKLHGLSASPPTMVLDRSSDLDTENLNLPDSSSKLVPFDGVVLEVSELGDVLTVMIL